MAACPPGAGLVFVAASLSPARAGDVLRAALFAVGGGGVMFVVRRRGWFNSLIHAFWPEPPTGG